MSPPPILLLTQISFLNYNFHFSSITRECSLVWLSPGGILRMAHLILISGKSAVGQITSWFWYLYRKPQAVLYLCLSALGEARIYPN